MPRCACEAQAVDRRVIFISQSVSESLGFKTSGYVELSTSFFSCEMTLPGAGGSRSHCKTRICKKIKGT